jgi:hypothetical protein
MNELQIQGQPDKCRILVKKVKMGLNWRIQSMKAGYYNMNYQLIKRKFALGTMEVRSTRQREPKNAIAGHNRPI